MVNLILRISKSMHWNFSLNVFLKSKDLPRQYFVFTTPQTQFKPIISPYTMQTTRGTVSFKGYTFEYETFVLYDGCILGIRGILVIQNVLDVVVINCYLAVYMFI